MNIALVSRPVISELVGGGWPGGVEGTRIKISGSGLGGKVVEGDRSEKDSALDYSLYQEVGWGGRSLRVDSSEKDSDLDYSLSL